MFLFPFIAGLLLRPHPGAASRSEYRAPLWNTVAQCESGGRWHIDTGNGFRGGLQFMHSTWVAFGGLRYAPTASLATRWQQMEVANRVLAVQGWGAWPVCGLG